VVNSWILETEIKFETSSRSRSCLEIEIDPGTDPETYCMIDPRAEKPKAFKVAFSQSRKKHSINQLRKKHSINQASPH
jgi:hypothetical protein